MAYQRKTAGSNLVSTKTRLTAMLTIDKNKKKVINYGEDDKPLSAVEVAAEIAAQEKRIADYNALLDPCDSLGNAIKAGDKLLGTFKARVLKGASSKFGEDADEVEQLGGTRQSERARPVRKPKTTPGS